MAEQSLRVLHLIRATGISGAERQLIDLLASDRRWPGVERELRFLRAGSLDLSSVAAGDQGFSVTTDDMRYDLSPALIARLADAFSAYDIVHTHLVHADWHALIASKGRRSAWVTTKHNQDAFRTRRAIRGVERRVNEAADLTVAISQSLARFTELTTGVLPAVVPYGYGGALSPAARSLRDQPPFRLLGLGRLVRQKGFDTAIEATSVLRAAGVDVSLTLAGEGPDRADLEAMVKRLGLTRHVRFAGWIEDVRPLLEEHDLLIHPARWEGFGLVLLEAMAAGLPVVGSTAGAVPEVLGDAAVAIVPPGLPAELAAAIEASLSETTGRRRAAEAGRHVVVERLSLDRSADCLREHYEVLLKQPRRSHRSSVSNAQNCGPASRTPL